MTKHPSVDVEDDDASIDSFNKQSPSSPSLRGLDPELLDGMVHNEKHKSYSVKEQHEQMKTDFLKSSHHGTNGKHLKDGGDEDDDQTKEGRNALIEIENRFSSGSKKGEYGRDGIGQLLKKSTTQFFIIPRQAAYSGSQAVRVSKYGFLSEKVIEQISSALRDVLGIQLTNEGKKEDTKYCLLYGAQSRQEQYWKEEAVFASGGSYRVCNTRNAYASVYWYW